jgi:hypothetical protein
MKEHSLNFEVPILKISESCGKGPQLSAPFMFFKEQSL